MPNLELIKSIIVHFKAEADKPETSPDTKESLEVAVQCLQTAYDIDPSKNLKENALPLTLEEIYQIAVKSLEIKEDATTGERMQQAEMMKNLGNNLMKSDQYLAAEKYYTSAIELDNHNAIYYGNRAAAYSKLNDFYNAIKDCEKAIEIDPAYAKAYGRMGLAYASLDKHEEAIKAFKQAVELDPANESYQSNLKIAQEKKDRPTSSAAGGLAGLSSVDWHTLFTNPAFRNMASTLMQDPNIITALSASMTSSLNQGSPPPSFGVGVGGDVGGGGDSGIVTGTDSGGAGGASGPVPNIGGSRNLDMLLEAGQYLAAQMQAANPDLVEQFRQSTSRTFSRQNPDNTDSSTQ